MIASVWREQELTYDASLAASTPATVPFYLPLGPQTREELKVSVNVAAVPGTRDLPELAAFERASLGKPIDVTLAEIYQLPQAIRKGKLEWDMVAPVTLAAARSFILRFWFMVKTQLGNWRSPHVASDGNGEVTFEWWCDTRSLTFIIHPDKTVSYLTTWGLHMWDEMEEGENPTQRDLAELWTFLQEGK